MASHPFQRQLTRSRAALAVALLMLSPGGVHSGGPRPDGAAAPATGSAPGVAELQAELAAGRITSEELIRACLARADSLDRRGPCLGAVLEWNPEALACAAALDEERRARGPRGPLHGIPVLVKGNIDTGDLLQTTAGSLALAGHRAAQDAFLVARLRQAGAVILGKTNLSEWANFRSTHSTSGWSSQGGPTRNPHVLDRNPCGSSSGSAVAVAVGYAPLAVGTETDGSIVCPAGTCGVVGLKPTLGLVSRCGILPIAHSQDTAGPMARSVRDVALLLQVLAAPDSADAASQELDWPAPDYLAALGDGDLTGMRVGVMRDYAGAGVRPEVESLFAAALDTLRRLGAVLVDPAVPTAREGLDAAEYQVLLHEFHADLEAYLASHGRPNDMATLEDLIRFNEDHHAGTMRHFGQEIFHEAAATGPLSAPAYREALALSKQMARAALGEALAHDELDLLVAPTNGPAWLTDLLHGDNFSAGVSSSTLPAVAGWPALTLPMGMSHGLPVGLTLLGPAQSEPVLLRAASALEGSLQARRDPALRPTLQLE